MIPSHGMLGWVWEMREEPVHHGILGTDIEGFGRSEWTDPIRSRLRRRLHDLVERSLARAEIAASATTRSDTGDGLLLLVHGEVSIVRLLRATTALADELAVDNQRVAAAQRLRLRVVVHAGEILHDMHGHTGDHLNHACRLLDADATRGLLAGSRAAVIVVVSDEVYQGVVRHAYAGIDPAGWQPILVHAKETTTRAWAHLPGLEIQPDLAATPALRRTAPGNVLVPRELPRPIADFSGRAADLAALLGMLNADAGGADWTPARSGPPSVITVIDGMGGIGKPIPRQQYMWVPVP